MSNLESQSTNNSVQDDIDEDDDQTNAPHKVVANIHKPSNSGAARSNKSSFDPQNLVKSDVKTYLNTTVPQDYSGLVQCHIKREKEGLTKGFATTYSLYLDGPDASAQTLLLVARKHLTIGGHTEFFIGANAENATKNLNEENSVAKLRGINLTGTQYVLYDQQNSSDKNKQSAAIVYDDHIFEEKEPRKLIVLLQDSQKNAGASKDNETIVDQWRAGQTEGLIELKNKAPTYNEETKTYTLDLQENRVKQPSHKNFQLISSQANSQNNVAMQFGRIDDNTFALDYGYPLTAVQAFAVALSSFHSRLRT